MSSILELPSIQEGDRTLRTNFLPLAVSEDDTYTKSKKMGMRLGILMSVASPWAREIALGLTITGKEVHVIDFAQSQPTTYLRKDDSFQLSSIECFIQRVAGMHFLPGYASRLGYISAIPALKNILKRWELDALLVTYAGGFAVMAYLSGFRPYVVYVVGSDILFLSGIWRPIIKLVLQSAQSVFSVGGYLREKTRELVPDVKVEFLLPGIDVKKYKPGKPSDSPIKIFCSRGFLPLYNNGYLVQALAEMPLIEADYQVTFAAPGPTLFHVKSMAAKLLSPEVQSRVRFLGGVCGEDMLKELQSSHIYVSLSLSDGTSNSLLEALACGLFPIVSDIPQNREWVGQSNGILVPFGKPRVLADALVRAITDQHWRDRVLTYNREIVAARADSSQNVAELASRIELIIRNYRGRKSK